MNQQIVVLQIHIHFCPIWSNWEKTRPLGSELIKFSSQQWSAYCCTRATAISHLWCYTKNAPGNQSQALWSGVTLTASIYIYTVIIAAFEC